MLFLYQEILGLDYLNYILLLLLWWNILLVNLNSFNKSALINDYLLSLALIYKKKVSLIALIPFIFIVNQIYGQILLSIYLIVLLFFICKRKEIHLTTKTFRTYFTISLISLIYIVLASLLLIHTSLNILSLMIIYIITIPLLVFIVQGLNSLIIKIFFFKK